MGIVLAVVLVAVVFCYMSMAGYCGSVGAFIRRIMYGTFGVTAWFVPVFFLGLMFFILAGRKQVVIILKAVLSLLLYWVVAGLLQQFMMPYKATATYQAEFEKCAELHKGGGVLGAFIVHTLRPALGSVGLVFVLLLLAILFLSLITDGAPVKALRGKSVGRRERAPWEQSRTATRKAEKQQRTQERPKKPSRPVPQTDPKYYDIKDDGETDLIAHTVTIHTNDGDSVFATLDPAKDPVPRHETKEHGISVGQSPEVIELNPAAVSAPAEPEKPSVFTTVGDPEAKKPDPVKKTATTAKPKTKPKTSASRASKPKASDEPSAVIPDVRTADADTDYQFPPYSLLARGRKSGGDSASYLQNTARKLEETLQSFGVNVTVTDVSCGPAVTRYEMQPEAGVKVSRIVSLESDIKLNLAASDIRIEAPIPGKAAVGIEVPNKTNTIVMLRDLLEHEDFVSHKSRLAFAAGRDIAGQPVIADIQKMPHVLIAGATGSGKSVCINTIILSLLYRAKPDEVKMIMIDPKKVELSVYNEIPHLLIPVVTDPKKAAGALNWAVSEMTRRYSLFAQYGARQIEEYNKRVKREMKKAANADNEEMRPLPQIVIIVDELADLMMVSSKEVEDAIVRLTQLARAAGIHLVIATQRPSVNVITGLIKANMPSRIAFAVTSGVDSRTILDMNGAEKLLGRGDMLFFPIGYPKPVRVQGAFVSDDEVFKVVEYLKSHNQAFAADESVEEKINHATKVLGDSSGAAFEDEGDERDVYFEEAGRFIIEKEKASIGMLQRRFKIGFNRAARIMDQLCEAGVVGEEEGTKPRRILMTIEEFEGRED